MKAINWNTGMVSAAGLVGAVVIAQSTAAGPPKQPQQAVSVPKNVTYAEHIAPILNNHCVTCHRPGEVAPFSLVGYEEASKRADMLAYVAQKRVMPPWKAVHGYGDFFGENRLTDEQIELLSAWAKGGAKRGDKSKEPPVPKFAGEWPLGQPDLQLSPKTEFKIPAEGQDVYRNFVLKTNFDKPKYIVAMDVKPGNRRVVHHVIAFVDTGTKAAELEAKTSDGQEGYRTFGGVGFLPAGSLGGWAPGYRPLKSPPGTAFVLKPGATIVLQVHYHPTGKSETDLTKIGLYFVDEKPDFEVQIAWIAKPFINIPPGVANHPESWEYKLPVDVTLLSTLPHMHLLGKSMKARAIKPDGTEVPLVWIDNWDFNWQMTYPFRRPIFLPGGSVIKIDAVYDNSDGNPNNPTSPPRRVRWGEETTDEMALLVVPFVVGKLDIKEKS